MSALATLGASLVIVTASAGAVGNGCAVVVTGENPSHNAVQTAVDTHPGQKICIGAGTYPEQIRISSSGTSLVGAGPTATVLAPIAPLAINTYNFDSRSGPHAVPAAAIILVAGPSGDPTTGVVGVTIRGITVDGAAGAATFTNCSVGYYGVDFQASSGSLLNSVVRNVAQPPSLFGCQTGTGLAILAYDGYFNFGAPAQPASVNINHTYVVGYQKNGITCRDPLEICNVVTSVVQGAGPTPLTGQNGIEIAFGALGHLRGDRVTNSSYNGTTATNDWYANGYSATGILLYDPANGTWVRGSVLVGNQVGIALYDDGLSGNGYLAPVNVTLQGDRVRSSAAYGIVANGAPGAGDSVVIASSSVNNRQAINSNVWGAPGILVDSGRFWLFHDSVSGASNLSGASNGAAQIVCGSDANTGIGTPLLSCATNQSIMTAAIQALSESLSSPTQVLVVDPTISASAGHRISTLGVLGGSVNLRVMA